MTCPLPDAFFVARSSPPPASLTVTYPVFPQLTHTYLHILSCTLRTLPQSRHTTIDYDSRVPHSHALALTPLPHLHTIPPCTHSLTLILPLPRTSVTVFTQGPVHTCSLTPHPSSSHSCILVKTCSLNLSWLYAARYLFFPASFSHMRKLWYREVTSHSSVWGGCIYCGGAIYPSAFQRVFAKACPCL